MTRPKSSNCYTWATFSHSGMTNIDPSAASSFGGTISRLTSVAVVNRTGRIQENGYATVALTERQRSYGTIVCRSLCETDNSMKIASLQLWGNEKGQKEESVGGGYSRPGAIILRSEEGRNRCDMRGFGRCSRASMPSRRQLQIGRRRDQTMSRLRPREALQSEIQNPRTLFPELRG